jgi:hypothetical protein
MTWLRDRETSVHHKTTWLMDRETLPADVQVLLEETLMADHYEEYQR